MLHYQQMLATTSASTATAFVGAPLIHSFLPSISSSLFFAMKHNQSSNCGRKNAKDEKEKAAMVEMLLIVVDCWHWAWRGNTFRKSVLGSWMEFGTSGGLISFLILPPATLLLGPIRNLQLGLHPNAPPTLSLSPASYPQSIHTSHVFD